jgi:cobalt-zinc-cadmium efflux system protein
MGHNHNNKQSTRQIRLAFYLNLAFTIFEIIGGLYINSLAILSDALHDLGDSFSLGLAWILDKYSDKKPDNKFSYGYSRFSLLAALINTLVLIIGSIFILSKAIPRLIQPEHSNAQGMVLFAVVGILINGLAVLKLRKDNSINVRVVMLHLLEDVLGWIAVLIVGIVLIFKDIHILDPILSILVTLYVLYNVIHNLKKTLTLFLQGVPENISITRLEDEFKKISGVQSVHHTHVWSLDGEHHVLTTHLVVENTLTRAHILSIKKKMKLRAKKMKISHTTVEIEYDGEHCEMFSSL